MKVKTAERGQVFNCEEIDFIETDSLGVIEITTLNETCWQVPIAMALVMQVRDGKPFIVIG
jgi:hypothetical protein